MYETKAEADRAILELNNTEMKPGYPHRLSVTHLCVSNGRYCQIQANEVL